MKDNKIIAEFMGEDVSKIQQDTWGCKQNELQYHTSWDWLMPVVSKILWLEDYEDESYDDIYNGLTNALLSQTYDAVVEFIQEYRLTPKEVN